MTYKKKFFKKKVDKEEDVEEDVEENEEEEEQEDVKVEKKKVAKTVAKKTNTPTANANDKSIDLGGTAKAPRKISYSNYKGFERIDIREFFQTSNGELRQSNKGIQLTFDQWKIITENIDTINSWIPKEK